MEELLENVSEATLVSDGAAIADVSESSTILQALGLLTGGVVINRDTNPPTPTNPPPSPDPLPEGETQQEEEDKPIKQGLGGPHDESDGPEDQSGKS